MTPTPIVSVVIPLYNKGPYIGRALDSVLNQSCQNFEVIVVDDGSTDNGAATVNGFEDPRIRLIRQENSGVSAARNRGIKVAHANFIAFLDADDEWLPNHLETLLDLREKYPEAGLYGTAYYIKKENLEPKKARFSRDIPKEPWEGLLPSYFRAATFGDPPISSSTAAVPIYILNEMGGFSTETWWGEDTDLWGRIALKYPIAFSWNGGGIYHTDIPNRACDRVEPLRDNLFVINAWKAISNNEVPLQLKEDLLEYVASKQMQTARRNLAAGRPDLARENLRNCRTRHQWLTKHWVLFWAHIPSEAFIRFRNFKRSVLSK